MQLKGCSIKIRADLFTATTFMEWEFYNPNDTEIEGLHRFELKPGQVITAFQLDLHGKYRDGSIEEKWKATNAYNTIVGKRIDPALLTMDYANQYSLRIYPIAARSTRKVTLTIMQMLTPRENELLYLLPLNFPGTGSLLDLSIEVSSLAAPVTRPGLLLNRNFEKGNSGYELKWITENIALNHVISFAIPLIHDHELYTSPRGDQADFAIRTTPVLDSVYNIHPRKIAVFWDASASTTERAMNREVNFLRQYMAWHRVTHLTIIPFNHKTLDTAVFSMRKESGGGWQQYLRNINYDGATQFGVIDTRGLDVDIVFVFTDGHNSYGKSIPVATDKPVFCINTSTKANYDHLREIPGTSGGSLINLKENSISDAITMSSRAENWLLKVTAPNGRLIINQYLPLRSHGPQVVTGTLDSDVDTIYLEYGNGSGVHRIQRLPVDKSGGTINEGVKKINLLSGFDQVIRSSSWNDLVDFGLKEKVVTPYTAYIVLERVEDYVKYNITPPKELEAECEKLQYVKRDTRFERRKMQSMDQYQVLNSVVNVYNSRLKKLDPNARTISLEKQVFETHRQELDAGGEIRVTASGIGLQGKLPGLNISNSLDEVVVVGYGTVRKQSLTGSIAIVESKTILNPATSVEQILQGRVAGVQVTNASGQPGSPASVMIRGSRSISGNNQPLYVIDGLPVSGNINDVLSVNDIETIAVLKDNAASSLYGCRAVNGAIVITSKKGRHYNPGYSSRPYRLKDMEDVEYLQELASATKADKPAEYERLKTLYGDDPGFYMDAAQHFFGAGLEQKSYSILMNAAEIAAGNHEVLIAMAWIFEKWGRFDEAIGIYEMLLKKNPFNISLYRDMAWVFYQQGKYQQAVDSLYNGISLNTEQMEHINTNIKATILTDLNAIIALHGGKLDLSRIPPSIIIPETADLRIDIESNNGNPGYISIREPGGAVSTQHQGASKNGGLSYQAFENYSANLFVYQLKNAKPGRYRISTNYYNGYYVTKFPSVIRIRVIRNLGRHDQVIELENLMMDNQHGEIEIADLKWAKK